MIKFEDLPEDYNARAGGSRINVDGVLEIIKSAREHFNKNPNKKHIKLPLKTWNEITESNRESVAGLFDKGNKMKFESDPKYLEALSKYKIKLKPVRSLNCIRVINESVKTGETPKK